jgi:hypothetical protein
MGVSIELIPQWVGNALDTRMGALGKAFFLGNSAVALMKRFTGDCPPESRSSVSEDQPPDIFDVEAEPIRLVNVCLWLVRPSFLSFKWQLHFKKKDPGWIWKGIIEGPELHPNAKDTTAVLDAADFDSARRMALAIETLSRENPVWTALRLTWTALANRYELRYLALWMALESLFGPKDPGEITYRLSERIAYFVSSTPSEREDSFKMAKKCYDLRSRVAHGAPLDPKTIRKSVDHLCWTEDVVRRVITKILGAPDRILRFFGDSREDYLRKLTLGITS